MELRTFPIVSHLNQQLFIWSSFRTRWITAPQKQFPSNLFISSKPLQLNEASSCLAIILWKKKLRELLWAKMVACNKKWDRLDNRLSTIAGTNRRRQVNNRYMWEGLFKKSKENRWNHGFMNNEQMFESLEFLLVHEWVPLWMAKEHQQWFSRCYGFFSDSRLPVYLLF